ncbi:hypothetical protein [Streptomyces marincola]|uniref:Tetratricopeptide repeat protein n=1 Tax=Streptomyces marincola TaxID=2878388 RepID=A0A1W7D1A4_9ACTN|nr:hypothetical protein [Streptomyces marincola]ARQ70737.1 hypothetical protein CAG99_19530 [Streptomyces marincola]
MAAVAAVADTHVAVAGLGALSAVGLITGADGRRPAGPHVRYRMPPEAHAHATAAAEAYGTVEENMAVSHRICAFYLRGAQQAGRRLEPFRDSLSRDRSGDGEPLCASRCEALVGLDVEYPTIDALLRHPSTPSGALIALHGCLVAVLGAAGVRERVRQAHARGLEAARALGDRRAIGRMLTSGGLLAREVAPQQSHDLLTEAIELYEDAGDEASAARGLHYLAHAELARGDRDGARHLWLRAVAELHRVEEPRTAALALIEIAAQDVADQRGSSAAALADSGPGLAFCA